MLVQLGWMSGEKVASIHYPGRLCAGQIPQYKLDQSEDLVAWVVMHNGLSAWGNLGQSGFLAHAAATQKASSPY